MSEYKYRLLEDNVLSLPGSPAEWNGKPILRPITVITMTCGGGMGGSYWKEYVLQTKLKFPMGEMLYLIDATTGKEFTVNPRYVVKAENFILVEAHYSTTNDFLKERDRGIVRAMLQDYETEVFLKDNHGIVAYKGELEK